MPIGTIYATQRMREWKTDPRKLVCNDGSAQTRLWQDRVQTEIVGLLKRIEMEHRADIEQYRQELVQLRSLCAELALALGTARARCRELEFEAKRPELR